MVAKYEDFLKIQMRRIVSVLQCFFNKTLKKKSRAEILMAIEQGPQHQTDTTYHL